MPEVAVPKLRPMPPPATPAGESDYAYAELDVTSNFSFLRGASHPDELVYRAAELGYRAIAITDLNSVAGVVRAHAAAKQAGLKLVVGTRLQLADAPDLLAWPTDRAAYGRLCRLLTLGKRRAGKGQCALTLEDFLEHHEGMLAAALLNHGGTEARRRENAKEERKEGRSELRMADSQISDLKAALGPRLSLTVSRLYGPDDHAWLRDAMSLSRHMGIPLLATNAVHYHDPARRVIQDVLVCIREGCTIHDAGFRLFPNGERYLKPPAQMHRLFADCPAAIRRGLEIAEQCTFNLDELRYEYPDEVVPAGKTAIEHLADLAWAGAAARWPTGVPPKVRDLIIHELKLIRELKFEPYFLTVYDLVQFARSRGILCQGRGSAANSAVCYCIGITSVDPSRIDVLFERFISSARGEPPDIDVDFEHERREEVIQYIYEKYGRERAGMTAEIISYRGRSAVRDVGKALGLSLDMVDQMAKQLDWWHRGTIAPEQLRACGLDPADRAVRQVVEITAQILGFPRHLSQHVGGMVMTRGPLCEMVPIENAAMEDRTVIEWDKDDIDALGILKVDCLALGMLTCISKCFKLLNSRNVAWAARPWDEESRAGRPCHELQLHTIPPEDPAVYDMISNADTIGVFQIESRAQMSMLPRLRPRCFYDLVIEVAIVRPGPIQGDMVHPYLRRRNGEEPVTYPSEAIREVLAKTLGVPLFQEQAMRLVMVGAGFTAEEADKLRRAMAAWRRYGQLDAFHEKIVKGMLANGYTAEFAERCFGQIRGFGEYGFPESHAASFALLVYVSAWLKRYHPAAFATALLNSQPMGFYAPAQIVRDAREHGVVVHPVDVNSSGWDCTLEDSKESRKEGREEKTNAECRMQNAEVNGNSALSNLKSQISNPPSSLLRASVPPCLSPSPNPQSAIRNPQFSLRLGFRQLKGFKSTHARRVVDARDRLGRFASVEQFHRATGLPVSALRTLAEADAFSSLGLSRREALWQTMAMKDEVSPLFDAVAACEDDPPAHLPTMPLGQEIMTDYLTAGLSLKSHPLALMREELEGMKLLSSEQLRDVEHGQWVKTCGLVLIRQRPSTAAGVVFVTLEDETGIVNLLIRPTIYERYRAAARLSALLQAEGRVQRQGQVMYILADRLTDLSSMLTGYSLRSRDFH